VADVTDLSRQRERAGVLLSMRRYEEAVRLLADVVAAEPDSPRAWCMLAQAQLGVGRAHDGLLAARRAIALDPALGWPHRLASAALQRIGDCQAAVDSALEACRLEPHTWLSHLALAQAAINGPDYIGPDAAPRFELAGRAVAAARELAPEAAEVHFVAGQLSLKRGDKEAAAEHFRRALACDPAHGSALNELGRISLEQGNTGAAARHFIQAARTAPGERVYGHNVAIAVGRTEASIRRLVAWVIYGSWLGTILAIVSGPPTLVGWVITLTALGLVAGGVVAMVVVQLRRLPPEARALFRGGYLALALGITLGSLAIGIPAVQYAAGRDMGTLAVVVVLLVAARFAAFEVLKRGARRRQAQLMGSRA
jgi:tetratricopeptide (TPR) repeat protein